MKMPYTDLNQCSALAQKLFGLGKIGDMCNHELAMKSA